MLLAADSRLYMSDGEIHVSTAGRRGLLLGSFVFSQLVLLLILRMPAVPGEGSWLQAFRGYFSYDQLSYAAIASTAAAGDAGLPEPFTETGHSYYPSLWYRILGWLSALTGLATPTVWTIAGYLLLASSIAFIGYVAFRISRLPWAPALVAPALLVGSLSIILHDYWYTTLDSHAVLWGPYGAIYVLNAEVAGFACVGSALSMILWACLGAALSTRKRVAWLVGAAALLGITANFHTYIFFLGAGIAFAWIGAYGLLRSRSRALLISTGAIIVATFVLGGPLAGRVGALPVYGLLILCTLPGIAWLVRPHVRVLVLPAIVFVVTAAPQAIIVASGILRKDDFLTYRQDVSSALGVPLWIALLASLPIIALWAVNVAVQRRNRNDFVLGALFGLGFACVMLTFNGAWGFGQEPYRFWIESVTAAALLLAPITAWSVAQRQSAPSGQRSTLVTALAGAAVILFALSLLDFGAFRVFVANSGVIRFDTARYDALRELTTDVDALMTTGPCLDPQEAKIVTRKPIAFYNLGIAWPENRGAIDAVVSAQRNGVFDPDAMRAADVHYLVTDSACATQWPVDAAMGVVSIGTRDYADEMGAGTLTLWRVV